LEVRRAAPFWYQRNWGFAALEKSEKIPYIYYSVHNSIAHHMMSQSGWKTKRGIDKLEREEWQKGLTYEWPLFKLRFLSTGRNKVGLWVKNKRKGSFNEGATTGRSLMVRAKETNEKVSAFLRFASFFFLSASPRENCRNSAARLSLPLIVPF
jgi:hypothetical protein